ncbi:U2 snRNP complex subunit CUS2 NDAI_0C02340 [Naumovozyma dairenensis CBS 421]|uniref:RRM domain-containing protein n=1 Tax=Naumovozyma dairenensis (strain ATCC 10597 / BCRC 20456 / CBS 421 / NBRC 0211 / NRRL Y-12639) TaxID=1071378 RepID=G0W7Y3_NAUDC|nr:hypothetical protein NDAI_0C02340 [Naumovozyma dairenensis CBS 421]CCD23894.1 hypothetical protein NDAI_0C02340 [Naumovozyma dairenensis CBS 421]
MYEKTKNKTRILYLLPSFSSFRLKMAIVFLSVSSVSDLTDSFKSQMHALYVFITTHNVKYIFQLKVNMISSLVLKYKHSKKSSIALKIAHRMEKEELDLKEALRLLKKQELERRKKKRDEKKSRIYEPPFTSIYISNLPKDITEDELIREFTHYGIIRKTSEGEIRCKLYKDSDGKVKGDALIVYARIESVQLAIDMMDKTILRGSIINVQTAQFKSNKRKIDDKNNAEEGDHVPLKRGKQLQKYAEDGTIQDDSAKEVSDWHITKLEGHSEADRTIVLNNVLDVGAKYTEGELDEIKEDIVDECSTVKGIERFELDESNGRALVVYEDVPSALNCRSLLDGRFFDGREIIARTLTEEEGLLNKQDLSNFVTQERVEESEDDLVDES